MTAIVGMLCSDGVVIGSDSSATFGLGEGFPPIMEQKPVKKVEVLHDCIIVAGTGQVGLGQRFCHIVDQAYAATSATQRIFGKHYVEVGTSLSALAMKDFNSTGIGYAPEKHRTVGYGALLAYTHSGKCYLCEFPHTNFQPEFKTPEIWYVSMGSGQNITDPFIAFLRRAFGKQQPTVAQASNFMSPLDAPACHCMQCGRHRRADANRGDKIGWRGEI